MVNDLKIIYLKVKFKRNAQVEAINNKLYK